MLVNKADIITQLKKDILPLQGIRSISTNSALDSKLGSLRYSFPNNSFPLGAIHEFIISNNEEQAATCGFVAGIISTLMNNSGALIWISASRSIFPPALALFGVDPSRIIFIDLRKEKEILWVMEEALKCTGLAAVIGEMQDLNFTASRRLQLAVEQSCVTGFVIRRNPKIINTTACVTRWMISPLNSLLPGEMPGVGFPRWNVELVKVRNGVPGKWELEYSNDRFRHIPKIAEIPFNQKKKTG